MKKISVVVIQPENTKSENINDNRKDSDLIIKKNEYLKFKNSKLDDLDLAIISELQKNPRESFKNISMNLEKIGFSTSSETVRRRVSNFIELINFLKFPDLHPLGLDNAILLLKTSQEKNVKKKIIQRLHELGGISIGETIGQYDIICHIGVKNNTELGDLIDELRGIEEIKEVEHLFITKTHNDSTNLFTKLK